MDILLFLLLTSYYAKNAGHLQFRVIYILLELSQTHVKATQKGKSLQKIQLLVYRTDHKIIWNLLI
jgi:hypothetical protein